MKTAIKTNSDKSVFNEWMTYEEMVMLYSLEGTFIVDCEKTDDEYIIEFRPERFLGAILNLGDFLEKFYQTTISGESLAYNLRFEIKDDWTMMAFFDQSMAGLVGIYEATPQVTGPEVKNLPRKVVDQVAVRMLFEAWSSVSYDAQLVNLASLELLRI